MPQTAHNPFLEKKVAIETSTTKISPKAVQEQVTFNILNSIAKQGLLPKKLRKISPCLRSADPESGGAEYLCLNEFDLNSAPGTSLTQKLEPLVSEMSAGVWPVTLERNYKLSFPKDASLGLMPELEKRLEASVVFIFKKQPDAKFPDSIKQGKFRSDETDDISFYEYRTFSPVSTKDLLAILGPQALQAAIKETFPKIPFVEVKPTKAKVIMPMLEVQKYWPSKFFDTVKSKMTVLDYVSGFESFINTQKHNSFACHVVRLPTLKDVEYGLSNKLSEYQTAEKELETNVHRKESEAKRRQEAESAAAIETKRRQEIETAAIEAKRQHEIETAAITVQSRFKGSRVRELFLQYKKAHSQATIALKDNQLEQLEDSLQSMKQIRSTLRKA